MLSLISSHPCNKGRIIVTTLLDIGQPNQINQTHHDISNAIFNIVASVQQGRIIVTTLLDIGQPNQINQTHHDISNAIFNIVASVQQGRIIVTTLFGYRATKSNQSNT